MARVCYYCAKRPMVGNKISHSNIKTKIRHIPNLQNVRAMVDGVSRRIYACTRCIRSGWVTKPLFRKAVLAQMTPPAGTEATA